MIIDPLIIAALSLGLYLASRNRRQRQRLLWGAVMLVSLYIGGRAWVHHDLYRQVAAAVSSDQTVKRVSVLPPVSGISNWSFVAESDQNMILGSINIWQGITEQESFPKAQTDPVVTAALRAPAAEVFLGFARHPYLTYEKIGEHYLVRIVDMRYRIRNRTPFMAVVQLDRNLNIIDSGLGNKVQ